MTKRSRQPVSDSAGPGTGPNYLPYCFILNPCLSWSPWWPFLHSPSEICESGLLVTGVERGPSCVKGTSFVEKREPSVLPRCNYKSLRTGLLGWGIEGARHMHSETTVLWQKHGTRRAFPEVQEIKRCGPEPPEQGRTLQPETQLYSPQITERRKH
jgi:hypothetical protein